MLKRLAHAFLAFSFGQLIVILTNILLVPLYLRVWSPAIYGEWLAIYSVVMYLSNLDLGMQTYVLNRLTQSYARHDMADYKEQQHSAVAFYLALATGGTVLLAIVSSFAPLTKWFNFVYTSAATARLVFVLLGAQVLWSLLGVMTFSVYRTTGRVATSQWISNGYRLLSTAATALSLVWWRTLPAVAIAQLAAFILVATPIAADVHHRYPELSPRIAGAKYSVIVQQLRPSVLFGLIALAAALGIQGSNLVVVGSLGGAALALFATSRTLVNSIRQVVSICTNVSWTDMTRMEAVGEHARLQTALKLVVIASTAICLAIAAPLWFEGASVIQVWTGHKLAPDVPLLRFLLAYVILQTPWMAASIVPLSTNKNRRLAISYLVANATGIAIAAAIVRPLGMIGLPLGLMCGEAIACYHFVTVDACRIVGEPYLPFAARVWFGLTLTAAVSLLAAWKVHQLGALPIVVRWLMSGFVSTVVVAAATWFGWLPVAVRRMLQFKIMSAWDHFVARTVPA